MDTQSQSRIASGPRLFLGRILLASVFLGGCGSDSYAPWGVTDPAKTQQNWNSSKRAVLEQVAFVAKFHELVDGAEGGFARFAQDAPDGVEWTSTGTLYDRYIVRVSVVVTLDAKFENVQSHAAPVFTIQEVTRVEERSSGRSAIFTQGFSKTFDLKTWERVVAKEGRMDLVFPAVRREDPVAGFDKVKQSNF